MSELTAADVEHLRATFALARQGATLGNVPFAARLVGADGLVLAESYNTVGVTGDCTAHAEMTVLRQLATPAWTAPLSAATLYTSAEPCAMCAGAICWSGIGRVVFGLSAEQVRALDGAAPQEPGIAGLVVLRQAPMPR